MSDQTTPPPDDREALPSGAEPEQTGLVELNRTQILPQEQPDRGWFDTFTAEHPTEGPTVPTRADAPWGSDRADALAEEAHQAAYAAQSPYGPPPPPAAAGDATAQAVPLGPVPVGAVGATSPTSDPTAAPTAGPVSGATAGAILAPDAGPPGSVPVVVSEPAPPRKRRRGLLVAGIAALCLLSGVTGGVVGQIVNDRVHLGGSTLPEPGPGASARPAGSVANIAANVLPSVVTIKVDAGGDGEGTGSGFVIDAKGHILTNNHVVAAGAQGGVIEVFLSNGDTEKATIVGRDVSYDLAVLRIARKDLTPLALGRSDQVVVGDQVIAVGAPLGLDQTVTTGIVSALNRPVSPGAGDETSFMNAIQTDAAINPGNSGGPLLDMSGKVIGVNSAIARVPGSASASGGNIGLGFAIPSDQARRTSDQLIATGKSTHPVIGVMLDRTFSDEGAMVLDKSDAVTKGGPAEKAGVKPGDVIVGFEGKRVRTPDQLIVSIRARAVGETVTLKIERDGSEIELKMTLQADPTN